MKRSDLAALTPDRFVDLARYPVDRLDAPEGRRLVAELREILELKGACRLPGFVRPEIAAIMAEEMEALSAQAGRGRSEINPYEFDPDLDAETEAAKYPENHPRRRLLRRSFRVLPYKDLPDATAIRRLYHWEALPPLLAGILGFPRMYRFDDEYQAINVLYMGEGGEQQWHFDSNDFTITLMMQKPERGGSFQYAPNIRTPKNENYDAVAKLLDGDLEGSKVVTVPIEAGDLMVFRGKYSMHRATPVEGARDRILAVLCFDTEKGRSNLAATNRRHYVDRPA